jgi:hypothetical protein
VAITSAIVITAVITDQFCVDEQKRSAKAGLFLVVIPGRASSREPGIQFRAPFWIPGSHHRAAQSADPLARPGMTKE